MFVLTMARNTFMGNDEEFYIVCCPHCYKLGFLSLLVERFEIESDSFLCRICKWTTKKCEHTTRLQRDMHEEMVRLRMRADRGDAYCCDNCETKRDPSE